MLSAILLTATAAFSQSKSASGSSYKNALGVKVWDGGGISYKHFFNEKNISFFCNYFICWNDSLEFF